MRMRVYSLECQLAEAHLIGVKGRMCSLPTVAHAARRVFTHLASGRNSPSPLLWHGVAAPTSRLAVVVVVVVVVGVVVVVVVVAE